MHLREDIQIHRSTCYPPAGFFKFNKRRRGGRKNPRKNPSQVFRPHVSGYNPHSFRVRQLSSAARALTRVNVGHGINKNRENHRETGGRGGPPILRGGSLRPLIPYRLFESSSKGKQKSRVEIAPLRVQSDTFVCRLKRISVVFFQFDDLKVTGYMKLKKKTVFK